MYSEKTSTKNDVRLILDAELKIKEVKMISKSYMVIVVRVI